MYDIVKLSWTSDTIFLHSRSFLPTKCVLDKERLSKLFS